MVDRAQLTDQPEVNCPAAFVSTLAEQAAVTELARRLAAEFPQADGPNYFRAVALACHRLPEGLRAFLLDWRALENYPALVVSGFPVDNGAIGPTPAGWGCQTDRRAHQGR